MSLADRFWSKVDKTAGNDGCWLWTGSLSNGYGRIGQDWDGTNKQSPMYAHRVSWELAYSNIPKDAVIHHTCGTKRCVNPKHLELIGNNSLHRMFHDDDKISRTAGIKWLSQVKPRQKTDRELFYDRYRRK